MKSILALFIALSTMNAFAGPGVSSGDAGLSEPVLTHYCYEPLIQDAQLTASFYDVQTDHATVKLFIPVGEFHGHDLWGSCTKDLTADEFSMSCVVNDDVAANPTVYSVKLVSTGDTSRIAVIENMLIDINTRVVRRCF